MVIIVISNVGVEAGPKCGPNPDVENRKLLQIIKKNSTKVVLKGKKSNKMGDAH